MANLDRHFLLPFPAVIIIYETHMHFPFSTTANDTELISLHFHASCACTIEDDDDGGGGHHIQACGSCASALTTTRLTRAA